MLDPQRFLRRMILALSMATPALLAGACSGAKSVYNMPPGLDPAQRLDSLAAISHGDYLHIQFSPCLGRCEGYVSVYRLSPASYHVYDAEGYTYNEIERGDILMRARIPIGSDVADAIIRRADSAGLMQLVDDTSRVADNSAYMWVRARIGDRKLSLNNVYLGSKSYGSTSGTMAAVYSRLRGELFADLRRIRITGATDGR